MSKKIDMVGLVFNRLTVIKFSSNDKNGRALWVTKCDCGNEKVLLGKHLRNGNTTSCGCRKKEGLRTTHGFSKKKNRENRLYTIWGGMKQRCNYKKAINYSNYGGRGIKVCKRWNDSFENFLADMGESYYKHIEKHGKIDTSLDRKNNDKDYEIKNCKWSTKTEQYYNSRNIKK